jgi:hypothetical protein
LRVETKNKGIFFMANMKKMWSAMTASLVVVTGLLSADVCPPDCVQPYNVQCVQPANFDLCNPCNDSPCGHWMLEVDLLYWTACEGGLTYGSDDRASAFGTAGTFTEYQSKKKHPHQRWDLGFRIGLGFQFPCECWDASLIWTNFDTDGHGKYDEPAAGNQWFTPAWNSIPGTGVVGGNLLGGNVISPTTFPVDEARGHWKLRLNLLDLEIGREFCVNSCLTLRPFIGVRGASINDKYNIRYETRSVSTSLTDLVVGPVDRVQLKNNFEGAGVRGGLDTEYDLGCGMSIYGGVAASLLYGETEIRTKERLTVGATGLPTSNVVYHEQKDNDCGARAITDAEIGLRWKHCCCDKVIVMKFGWEHHFFFNQNQFEKFTNFNGSDNFGTDRMPQDIHGDLSVQGLVLSAKLDF